MTRTAYFHWRQRREHFWRCTLAKATGESGKRQEEGWPRGVATWRSMVPQLEESGVVTGFTWETEQHICRWRQPLVRGRNWWPRTEGGAIVRAKENHKVTEKAELGRSYKRIVWPTQKELGSFPSGRRELERAGTVEGAWLICCREDKGTSA